MGDQIRLPDLWRRYGRLERRVRKLELKPQPAAGGGAAVNIRVRRSSVVSGIQAFGSQEAAGFDTAEVENGDWQIAPPAVFDNIKIPVAGYYILGGHVALTNPALGVWDDYTPSLALIRNWGLGSEKYLDFENYASTKDLTSGGPHRANVVAGDQFAAGQSISLVVQHSQGALTIDSISSMEPFLWAVLVA